MENILKMAKTPEKIKKPEKSQAELRRSLEERFLGMKRITKEGMEEYKKALQEELFEDKEGEPEGSGEKRREAMQVSMNALFDRAEQMKAKLDSKEELPNYTESISIAYAHPDNKLENITFSLEEKLEEYIAFYKKTKLNLPPDFEDSIKEIWENNIDEIQKAIQENGFDDMLLMPEKIPLEELNTKMTERYKNKTWESSDFTEGGSFAGAKSKNVEKTRIVLVHKVADMKDRPELEETLNIKGEDVNLDKTLTLEDYLVFQRKFFEETKKHLDAGNTWTWLATKSGARLVDALWHPSASQVVVFAADLGSRSEWIGARPSRSFF
ncbi:MAG: hypothetical protein KBB88_01875 [Candidatus Pacebacteria bacterium]|nr:hypothetical protein [Candidatus Paceibacterota bacterium]